MVTGPDVDSSGALGRRRGAGREAAARRVGHPRAGRRAARVPRGPSELPRRAPARDRARGADAGGPRPGDRRRLVGVPVLPVHPRAAAARGRGAGGHHQRPRRGRPRVGGRRDRCRREAHARGAGGGGGGERPPGARAARRPASGRGHRPALRVGRARHAARGAARRGHRGAGVAHEHARAAQPDADLESRQLLLRLRRRPGLRPRGRGRRADGPAGPARWCACSARARCSTR